MADDLEKTQGSSLAKFYEMSNALNNSNGLVDYNNNALGFLNSLANNPNGRYYTDQTIFIDGYTFTNCCFNNCMIHTDSGLFALKACLIMQNCRILFGPTALRIIKLFQLRFPNPIIQNGMVFSAAMEHNGSVTIE